MPSRKRTQTKATRRTAGSRQRTLSRSRIGLDIDNRLTDLETAKAALKADQKVLRD